jgi:hypothetical protein
VGDAVGTEVEGRAVGGCDGLTVGPIVCSDVGPNVVELVLGLQPGFLVAGVVLGLKVGASSLNSLEEEESPNQS